jgi:DivIVA domain-containing protein
VVTTPEDIRGRKFLIALRGYDRDEVHAFLDEVAAGYRELEDRIRQLQADLDRSAASPATAPAPAPPVGEGADARGALQALMEESNRILGAAQESTRELEEQAKARAAETVDRARREARELVDRANGQAARTVAEAERRRDAVAQEITDLQAEKAELLGGLRLAVARVTDAVAGLEGALVAAEEAPAAPEPAPEPAAESGPEPEPVEEEAPPVAVEPEPEPEVEPEPVAAPPVAEEPVPEPEPEPEPDAGPEPDVPPEEPAAPTIAGRRAAALEELRPALARRIKRALQDVQNGVLSALREQGRGAELDAVLPKDPDLDELGALGQEHLATTYATALADAAAAVEQDTPAQLVDGARVVSATATFRAVLAHEITSSLRATLRAGLEAGEPEPQLSERVGEVFRDLRGPVVEALADEHLSRAYAHGLLDAWQELGVEGIRWVLGDEPRCPENRCRSNAGEGVLAIGVDFPSGDRVPPAHPGCTCTIEPA